MQATGFFPAAHPLTLDVDSAIEATYRKITRRLIPLLFFCYLLNYIDRINIGYAQLQMKQALGFSDAVYGLGAAAFFVGYFLLEVPSNLLLQRIGARKTILRIMMMWGLASTATMFVTTPMQFYVARFLLGVFEAGFLPGMILYLTFWYPPARRARIVALFMTATVVAGIIAGPLSGWILQHMNGVHDLLGWQWMFVLEGLPSCVLGVIAYSFLDDKPSNSKWLNEGEKRFVHAELADEQATVPPTEGAPHRAFLDPGAYLLGFASFTILCGGYAISFWLPTMIRGMGVVSLQLVGLYAAIPYSLAAVAMVWFGKRSDARQERRWHFAAAAASGAAGLVASTFTSNDLWLSIALLSLATAGIVSTLPIFWAISTSYFSRASAAAGIAIVTSVANLAGIASPYALGLIKTSTGSLTAGLYVIAALLVAGAITILLGIKVAPVGAASERRA